MLCILVCNQPTNNTVPDNATCNEVKTKEQDKESPGVTEGCELRQSVTPNMVTDEGNEHMAEKNGHELV